MFSQRECLLSTATGLHYKKNLFLCYVSILLICRVIFDKFGVLSSFVFSLVRENSISNYLTFSRYEKTALKFDNQKILIFFVNVSTNCLLFERVNKFGSL